MVGKLDQTRMTSFVTADGTADLKKYGLDKPQATATVGTGSSRATLAIGAKKEDGSGLYARDMSKPAVFTVDVTLLDDLTKSADDLRKKDLFEFRSFSAQTIEITTGGQTYVFEKPKAPAPSATPAAGATPPADVWKQTKPSPKDVDQTKLTDLMTTISNLKAEKFAEKALASGDDVTFTAKFGDPAALTTETVKFRKSGTVVHAIQTGDSGAAIVSTADYDKALALIKALTSGK
jgi:hypothetical protein